MAITLHFQNDNPPGVRLDIYRDIQPIDRANLPSPIATTTEHITQWIDETAIKGATYYYVFKTTGAIDSKTSRNIKVIALDDKGVGDDKLHYGNLDYGYYGDVSVNSFFTPQQLASALGLVFPTYGAPTRYHKFSYKGKTVFVPNAFIGKGLSYDELAAAGLVAGKTVQFGQFQYKVRLLKGFDTDLNFGDSIAAANAPLDTLTLANFDSEYDRLVYPIARYVPRTQVSHNMDNQTMTLLGYAVNVQFLMAELNGDSSLCLCRGKETETAAGLTHATAITPATKTAFLAFLPVLELITDVV